MPKIPRTLHYCFGLTPDFAGRPWSLAHHACLRSAIERIQPETVRFHYRHEPSGPWWDATRPLVDPVRIEDAASDQLSARLAPLVEEGGIFLEPDVLVLRSFDPLLEFRTVLGVENVGADARLGTGVIAAEAGAPFLLRWLEALAGTRGRQGGAVPVTVEQSDGVRILPFTAFHWPLWTQEHLEWLYETTHSVIPRQSFVRRLWLAQAWPYLDGLTPGLVRSRETNVTRWLRPFVADLPDDYGATGAAPPLRLQKPMANGPEEPEHANRREAFQHVYASSMWGKGSGQFYSGSGSRGTAVERYVEAMTRQFEALHQSLGRDIVVVDIGCGDFFVGQAFLNACPFIRYIGCDIVPELIEHHQKEYGSDRASFRVLDIVTDDPPEGDVCLVRQVFQHLSNRDVLEALGRLRNFEAVYLTEGNPVIRHGPVNPDKASDGHIRFGPRGVGRGLEWREPPFSLRCEEVVRAISPPFEAIVTDRVWID